jgi:hypothetical protein
MILENPENYKFIKFQKSNTKNKKYDAILMNKKTNKIKRVPFGDVRYNQYEDTTPLKLYKNLNTFDKERRRLYRLRHAGEDKNKYSSGYFSLRFLW